MNFAIVLKTFRDARLLFLLLLLAILAFEFLFVNAMGTFARDVVEMWKKFPFVLKMISTLLGGDVTADLSVTSLVALGFAHPFLYATTWAFLITVGTRVLVAEFDRGTADLLMTLPVSRGGLYCAVSSVWILLGIPICLTPWLGITLGDMRFPLNDPLQHDRLRMVVINFAALYLAIGCLTMWVSSFSTRRGVAVAIVLGILLFSFVWNFLVGLVPWMRDVVLPGTSNKLDLGVFGLLNYYKPLEIIRHNALSWRDLTVLLSVAAACWTAGLIHFSRRDIPAA